MIVQNPRPTDGVAAGLTNRMERHGMVELKLAVQTNPLPANAGVFWEGAGGHFFTQKRVPRKSLQKSPNLEGQQGGSGF